MLTEMGDQVRGVKCISPNKLAIYLKNSRTKSIRRMNLSLSSLKRTII